MEIFPYIADNRIKKGRTLLSVVMTAVLLCVLCTGCLRLEKAVAENDAEITVDAVTAAAPLPEEEDENAGISLRDFAGANTQQQEQHTLLRERNRSESDPRLFTFREKEGMDWHRICFDLRCKSNVSESKVRLGIFHLRLQSDDEEAVGPGLSRAA